MPAAAAKPAVKVSAKTVRQLSDLFKRNGYVRWQDEARLAKDKKRAYRKGHEVRLVASSKKELAEIKALLKQAGFAPGKPFAKSNQFRIPIYGKEEVSRFLKLIRKRK